LLSTISDESSNAIKGGTMLGYHPLTLVTYDPFFPGGHIRIVRRVYNQLWRISDGVGEPTDGEPEGDLVESWEMSPDNLTLTAKLHPKAKFPDVAPFNGRALTAQDVLSSWDFFLERGNRRSELANSINASAPITSFEAPDDHTIVINMAQPNSTILTSLGNNALGTFFIVGQEHVDGTVDIKTKAIGTGPFYVTTDLNDIEYDWKRNPNFTRFGGPSFVEEIKEPVLTETSAAIAQFRTGAIYWGGPQAEDIVPLKKENKDLDVWMIPPNGAMQLRWFFGHNDESPFKDERMRQAFRYTWDIDAYNDAMNNVAAFNDAGIPSESFLDTFLTAGSWDGWWLDPQGSDFGENAKYFEYNVDEAKKLMEAAGVTTFPMPFNMVYAGPGPSSYPPFYFPRAEVLIGFARDSGLFDPQINLVNYATEWNQYRQSKGQFNGASWQPDVAPPDPTGALFNVMHPDGSYFQGGSPELADLAEKALKEFDTDARKQLVYDAQRINAKQQYGPGLGQGSLIQITWPIIRNWLTFQGGTNNEDAKRFLDPSKAPGA
jgi:ABC-type transport system substrate-binding protein